MQNKATSCLKHIPQTAHILQSANWYLGKKQIWIRNLMAGVCEMECNKEFHKNSTHSTSKAIALTISCTCALFRMGSSLARILFSASLTQWPSGSTSLLKKKEPHPKCCRIFAVSYEGLRNIVQVAKKMAQLHMIMMQYLFLWTLCLISMSLE